MSQEDKKKERGNLIMTNTNIRITKAMKYNAILCALEGKEIPHNLTIADLEEFILHETNLLAKKNTSEKKPTKTQQENENIKTHLLEVLSMDGGTRTITEIQGLSDDLAAMSNQKVAALVRALVSDGKVERVEDKRKAYFKAL